MVSNFQLKGFDWFTQQINLRGKALSDLLGKADRAGRDDKRKLQLV